EREPFALQQIAKRRRPVAELLERLEAELNASESDGADVVDGPIDRGAPRDGGVAEAHRRRIAGTTSGRKQDGRRNRGDEIAACHHECTVPSTSRLTGRYAGSYRYFSASASSMSTPRPGVSPGCIAPLSNEYACGKTRSVSSVCRMYSWMPKLWTLRSKW